MSKVDKIIDTQTGREMYDMILPIYNDDEYQLYIYRTIGRIMEEIRQSADKLDSGLDITRATWAIPYFEEWYGLIPTDNQTIDERRRNVILKMNEYYPVTRKRMESIVDAYVDGGGTKIDDQRGDYIFEIQIPADRYADTKSIIKAVEETKPAHLDYKFRMTQQSNVYIASAQLSYEHVTLLPKNDEEKQVEQVVYLPTATKMTENTILAPEVD